MNQDRLEFLFKRLHKGNCTEAELTELDNWYHTLNGSKHDYEQWIKDEGGKEKLSITLYQRFNRKMIIQQGRARRQIYYRAVAVILVMLSVGFWFISKKQSSIQYPIALTHQPKHLAPGTNRAILTLANGKKVDLDNSRQGSLAVQSGVIVQKTTGGRIVYQLSAQANYSHTDTLAWNNISTPRAGQYQIELPDGTKVWLNAQTSLRYPVRFTGTERKVELTGEAYFEVAHNKAMPFRVVTAEQTVTVLGTHFNINAYPDESLMSTTLLEGSVKISDKKSKQSELLTPGNQAHITREEGIISIAPVSLESVIAWKNGYFIFDKQDIRSIMKILSRWYDVDVTYKLTRSVRYGGTFSRSSDLNELLKSFSQLGNIHFEIKERRIIVSN